MNSRFTHSVQGVPALAGLTTRAHTVANASSIQFHQVQVQALDDFHTCVRVGKV